MFICGRFDQKVPNIHTANIS